MKAMMKVTAVIFIMTIGLMACSKDNVVEFYSTGEWRIDRYYFNGNDNTDTYLQSHEDYKLNLKVGYDFTETQILNEAPYGVSGTWEVTENATKLRLYDSYNGTREYEITNTTVSTLKIKKGVEEWSLKRP